MTVIDMIQSKLKPGDLVETPSGQATFSISEISSKGVRVTVGEKELSIFIPIECWAMIPDCLIEKNWVELGGIHGDPKPDTLEYHIQKYTSGVSAVSYVAPILEKIGIAEIDRERPARIRLI